MKTKHGSLFLLGLLMLFSVCTKNFTPFQKPTNQINLNALTFPHSMKGWELYSWPMGNDWNYSILIGTNRLKSYEEVKTNKVIVTGEDSLKMVLDKFPANEMITWIGPGWIERCWDDNANDLSLPPQEILNDIKEYCISHKLTLQITD
jgi:hypothetical protein